MQLFTGHDIIISRSIREAQKNETSGSLASLHKKNRKKRKEIAGGIPQIFPLCPPCIALPSCTPRDEEALQTCLTGRTVGICAALCSLSSIMVGTVSTDAVTSVEHQTNTKKKKRKEYWREGAPMSNSSECLCTTGRPTRSVQSKDIAQLFVCVETE